ncbi:hypothetical protein [Hyphomicrobium nitrativorans]|nr:hypothetical protein [Hyphomicrobium nitrativorans]
MKASGGRAAMGPAANVVSNTEGAMVYDSATKQMKVCDGTQWLDIGNGDASTMVPNWPDALNCSSAAGSTSIVTLIATSAGSPGVYGYNAGANDVGYQVQFNNDGSWHSIINTAGWGNVAGCTGKTIAQLYAEGRAFNFVGGGGVPSGAVMAFDATACPSGWTEYTPARGRFLRGIDNGAGNDPAGTRAPGHTQADELTNHNHTATAANAGAHAHTLVHGNFGTLGSGTGGAMMSSNQGGMGGGTNTTGDHTHTITVANTGGAETRPKNVAVLFCRKS